MKTIELSKYDHYDCEKELYVIYVNAWDETLEFDVKIKDDDKVFDCYLLGCAYIPKSETYKCEYKVYEE